MPMRAQWFDYSEQRMIAAIRAMPSGPRHAQQPPRSVSRHARRTASTIKVTVDVEPDGR